MVQKKEIPQGVAGGLPPPGGPDDDHYRSSPDPVRSIHRKDAEKEAAALKAE